MYELICPSCRQPMRSAFVRIDAVATCPHCQQRFQVKAAHLHRAPAVATLGPDETDPLLLGLGPQDLANLREGTALHESRVALASAPASSSNPSAPAAPSGLSSNTSNDALAALQNARRSSPPAAAVASTTTAPPSRPAQPRLKASDRSPITVLMFVAVGLTVIIAATGLGWLMMHRNTEAGNLGATITPRFDPNTTRIPGDVQMPSGWRTVSLPAMAPEAQGPVQLSDEGWILGGAKIAFGAKLITSSLDPISLVTVQIWLVDSSNRRYTTAEIPVVLPNRRSPTLIRVNVPQELYERAARFESRVILGPRLEESVRLEAQDMQVLGSLKTNAIRLRIRNPSSQNINFIFGVLRALDEHGRIICQWRLQSSRDLNAAAVQEALIEAPLEQGMNVARWETDFAGLFVNPDAANISDTPAAPSPEQH